MVLSARKTGHNGSDGSVMRLSKNPWRTPQDWGPHSSTSAEALLSAWREDYDEPLREDPTPPGPSSRIADRFIRQAEVWPPNSHADGFRLRLDAMREAGEPVPQIDDLIRDSRLLIIGRRAVRRFRSRNDFPESLIRSGYRYVLSMPEDQLGVTWDEVLSALKHRFRQVDRVGRHMVASEPLPTAGSEYPDLLRELIEFRDAPLLQAWKRVVALGIASRISASLPPEASCRLADCVVQHIKECPEDLSWKTDLRLWGFHERCPEDPELVGGEEDGLPPSFEDVHRAWERLSNCRRPFEEDPLETLATSIAELPYVGQLVSMVDGWPVGSSLLGFLERLALRHPETLARLVNHPCTVAIGTILVHALKRERSSSTTTLDLEDEWHDVQSLLRSRLILGHTSTRDLAVALDLAEEDESSEHQRLAHPGSSEKPAFPIPEAMAFWGKLIAENRSNESLVDLLLQRLACSRSDPRFLVTTRLMHLMETRQPEGAARLAQALLAWYCSLEDGHIPDGSHAPELLGSLDRVLREGDPAGDRQFLCPPGMREVPEDLRHHGGFDIHLRNLAAFAEIAEPADLPRVAEALFEVRAWGVASGEWTWRLLSGLYQAGPPALVRFGEALVRAEDSFVQGFIDRLAISQPGPLEVAQIAQGLGPGHVTASRLGNLLTELMQRLWSSTESDICLGHLQALVGPLQSARMWTELKRCGDSMDSIAQRLSGPSAISYRTIALKARLQARFQEDRDGLLNLEPGSDRWAEAVIRAYQGVAALLNGDADRALCDFRRSLEIDPTDVLVLCHLPYCRMVRNEWTEAMDEIERAREVLHRDPPGELSVSEAICHYRLGHSEKAFEILRGLPPRLRRTPNSVLLRLSFMLEHAPDVETFREDLAGMRPSHPELAAIIESRLAPLTHLELAAPWIPGDIPRRVEFEELCRLAGHPDPSEFLLHLLVNSASELTRHPNLVRNVGEDATTDLLAWKLDGWLHRFRATARTRISAGHGPSGDGEPDLVVETATGSGPPRVLLTAEAKPWDGPRRVQQALRQLFGTSNAGQELVRGVLFYCRRADFDSLAEQVKSTLGGVGQSVGDQGVWPARCVQEHPCSCGSVRVFRSEHVRPGSEDGAESIVVVHTLVVDLVTGAAREVRRGGGSSSHRGQSGRTSASETHGGTRGRRSQPP